MVLPKEVFFVYTKSMDTKTAILNTLTYFDLFDYPLTLVEVWQFLFLPNSSEILLNQVAEELELLRQNHQVSFERGFYCLAGREQIIDTRETRHRLSIKKMRIARREAKRIMLIPGVLAVAVSNSLSFRNSRQGGDIDFFIITKDNAVWQSRGLVAGYAAVFDKRPRGDLKENKLCLCMFATESALNLEPYLLPSENNIPDVVRIYWLATLKSLAGDEAVWDKFYGANQWVNNFLPNLPSCASSYTKVSEDKKAMEDRSDGRQKKYSVIVPSFLEKILSNIQIKFLPNVLKQKIGQGNEVVTSFGVIKLHQNNGRREIRELFSKKCLI